MDRAGDDAGADDHRCDTAGLRRVATLLSNTHERGVVFDRALIAQLVEHTAEQPCRLGYLDTGSDPVIVADAPRVELYAGWPYVLNCAEPRPRCAAVGTGGPQSVTNTA